MNTLKVWVAGIGGTGRIELYEGEDSKKAADLAFALVNAASKSSFEVGVTISEPDTTTPPPAPAGARPGVAVPRR